jgi:hypothetical protein
MPSADGVESYFVDYMSVSADNIIEIFSYSIQNSSVFIIKEKVKQRTNL